MEYGGSPETFAWWRGRIVPGARMVLWTSRERTQQVTDLETVDGQPITEGYVRADDEGHYRFRTVSVYQTLYGEVLGGDGRLYRLDRADLGARVFGAEAAVVAAQGTADTAQSTATAAQSAANTAYDLITGELSAVNGPEGLTRLNADGKVPAYLLPSHTESFLTWGDYPTVGPEVWPSPVGFRGMGTAEQQGQVPENTLEGIRAYLDLVPVIPGQQVPAVWLDAYALDDGSTAVLRLGSGGSAPTLTQEIHPQDMNAVSVRTAKVSGSKWGPTWPDLPVPSLEDVLAEFRGRCLFVLRVHQPGFGISNLWRTVLTYGMEDSVLLCGDTGGGLGLTAGAQVMGLFETTATAQDFADLVAEGHEWVALNCAGVTPPNGTTQIQEARAAGLRVMAFPLTRHYEIDRCIAAGDAANPWGVDAYVTPDPQYCAFNKPEVTQWAVAPWKRSYAPGQLGNGDGVDAPVRHPVYGGNVFGTNLVKSHIVNDPDANETKLLDPGGLWCFWEHQGWGYRPLYAENTTTRRLEVTIGYQFRRGAGTSWLAIGFGFNSDEPFQYQGTGTTVLDGPPGQNGWVLVARGDGNLYLRKVTNGAMGATDAASNNTGPGGSVTPGPASARQRVRVRLYPDRVECAILSTPSSGGTVLRELIHPDTDLSHRGPYVAIGSRHAELAILYPTISSNPA